MVVIGMHVISERTLLLTRFETYHFPLTSPFSPEHAEKKNEISSVFMKK